MIVESVEDDKLATLEGEDAEMVEIRSIRDRSRVGSYVVAAMKGRYVDGAEKELNAALKMRDDAFPMRLLAPEPDAECWNSKLVRPPARTRKRTSNAGSIVCSPILLP